MTIFKPKFLLFCLALALSGCQSKPQSLLYDALGADDGVKLIVEDFINEVLYDKRIAHQFNSTDLDNFHDKLVEQICQVSGGPCVYSGKEMKALHQDLNIDQRQFNAVVEALIKAMQNNNVDVATQNRLLNLLAPMHQDIITK